MTTKPRRSRTYFLIYSYSITISPAFASYRRRTIYLFYIKQKQY
jgi:hypothetical protein